jgi:hypothetical protein
MRAGDRAEAAALGRDPRQALRLSFRASLTPPRVAEIDGEPAAMWGLGGMILSDVGAPWLVTTALVERVPVAFVKIARAELALMLALKPRLENVVMAKYTGACRLLEVLGFRLGPAEAVGRARTLFRAFTLER